jgi:nucleotide-binding universal stress UspA family protein
MPRATLTADTVLVVVDWNDRWEHTVRHAVGCAQDLNARLHILHVCESMHWLLRRVMDDASAAAQQAHQRALSEEHLTRAAALADGVEVTTETRHGKPAVEVLQAVADTSAGMLVLGTDGPRDAASILLGGTTERLLRLSSVPVYIAWPGPRKIIKHVIVPTGLGPSGARAAEVALGCIRGSEGRVSPLHMIGLPSVMRAYSGDVLALRAELEAHARRELETHVRTIRRDAGDAKITAILETNLETVPAEKTIATQARAEEADLICFALGGRRLSHGLMIGSVSQRLLRVLPCSLLALPDAWISAQG